VINIKKLLMLTLIPLVLSLLAAPAMAKSIGPQKAVGKNPHLMPTAEGVEALLPSGGMHSWTADTDWYVIDFMHGLDASKAKIPNAFPLTMEDLMELMTNETAALEVENKWGYMSYEVLVEMMTMELFMEFIMNYTIEHLELTINSTLDADADAGQPVVSVVDASLFSEGNKVLITDGLMTTMEYNVIAGIADNNLTMEYDLINDYTVTAGSMVIKSPTAEAMAEAMAEEMASMWPEGMYVRFVNVGK
jgi:hypothetical protein